MTIIEGWVHLPAPANSTEDRTLASSPPPSKSPTLATWPKVGNNYGTKKRRFTGIVVPAEDAVDIAQTMERVIRGEVEIAYGGLREVPQRR
jgi:hypothetical protein